MYVSLPTCLSLSSYLSLSQVSMSWVTGRPALSLTRLTRSSVSVSVRWLMLTDASWLQVQNQQNPSVHLLIRSEKEDKQETAPPPPHLCCLMSHEVALLLLVTLLCKHTQRSNTEDVLLEAERRISHPTVCSDWSAHCLTFDLLVLKPDSFPSLQEGFLKQLMVNGCRVWGSVGSNTAHLSWIIW